MKGLPKNPNNSPAYMAIVAALRDGRRMHKHQAAELANCHHYTAMRYLSAMHDEKFVRICGWHRCFGGPIPIYKRSDGRSDVKKPAALTEAEKQRRYRKKNPDIIRNQTRSRQAQRDIRSGRVRLGIWGM